MHAVSKFLEKNKVNIGLAFLVIAVVILLFVFMKKPGPKKGIDKVENLTATTSYYTADGPGKLGAVPKYILVQFTAPQEIGTDAKQLLGAVINLIEKTDSPPVYPTVEEIFSQKHINTETIKVNVPNMVKGEKVTVPFTLSTTTPLEPAKAYMVGISVYNDVPSIAGDKRLLTVYGDFTYVDLVLTTQGPGVVTGLTGGLKF